MSSDYWLQRINEINKEIAVKTSRLETVNWVKGNLDWSYDDDVANVNAAVGFVGEYLMLGISKNETVQNNLLEVLNYKQSCPASDATLSGAVSDLTAEVGELNTSIWSLQNELQSATSSYYAALEEERRAREAAEAAAREEARRAAEAAANWNAQKA